MLQNPEDGHSFDSLMIKSICIKKDILTEKEQSFFVAKYIINDDEAHFAVFNVSSVRTSF